MANFFEQFDEAPEVPPVKAPTKKAPGNFFEQFDEPADDTVEDAPTASGTDVYSSAIQEDIALEKKAGEEATIADYLEAGETPPEELIEKYEMADRPDTPFGELDYSKVTLSDAVIEGFFNTPGNFKQYLKNMYEGAKNIDDAIANVGLAVVGGLNKAAGVSPEISLGEEQFDAITDMLSEKYGGWENIKRSIAEEPVQTFADIQMAATLVLGGVGAMTRLPGLFGKMSKTSSLLKAQSKLKSANKLVTMLEPSTAGLYLTGAAAKIPIRVFRKKIVRMYGKGLDVYKNLRKKFTDQKVDEILSTGLDFKIKDTVASFQKLEDIIASRSKTAENLTKAAKKFNPDISVEELFNGINEFVHRKRSGPKGKKAIAIAEDVKNVRREDLTEYFDEYVPEYGTGQIHLPPENISTKIIKNVPKSVPVKLRTPRKIFNKTRKDVMIWPHQKYSSSRSRGVTAEQITNKEKLYPQTLERERLAWKGGDVISQPITKVVTERHPQSTYRAGPGEKPYTTPFAAIEITKKGSLPHRALERKFIKKWNTIRREKIKNLDDAELLAIRQEYDMAHANRFYKDQVTPLRVDLEMKVSENARGLLRHRVPGLEKHQAITSDLINLKKAMDKVALKDSGSVFSLLFSKTPVEAVLTIATLGIFKDVNVRTAMARVLRKIDKAKIPISPEGKRFLLALSGTGELSNTLKKEGLLTPEPRKAAPNNLRALGTYMETIRGY